MQCTCYPLRKSLNFVKVERKFSHGKQGVGIKWWCINGGWKLKDSVSFTKKWWGNENEAMKITLVCLCPRADWVVPNIRTALLAVSPWDLALWPILFLCNERGWPPVLLSFHLPGHGTQENWTIILLMFPPHGSKRDRHFSHCPEVSAVSPPPFTVSPSRSLWSHATNISKAVCLSLSACPWEVGAGCGWVQQLCCARGCGSGGFHTSPCPQNTTSCACETWELCWAFSPVNGWTLEVHCA